MHHNSYEEIQNILENYKTVAIVGLSAKPHRASYDIANYLIRNGYKVIPVNPNYDEILGEKVYKSLSEIPDEVELVNIFRRSEDVEPVVREAIEIKAKAVWMQLGIYNDKAAELAKKAGLKVVMDSCIKIEHSML